MKTQNLLATVLVFLTGLILAGCQSTGDTVDDVPVVTTTTDMGTTTGLGDDGQVQTDAIGTGVGDSDLLSTRVIYYDYNADDIRADFTDVVAAHAGYLVNNPGQRLRLEGHADERGSREYNLALGERRAQRVRQMLRVQGVDSGQVEIVSYGEEAPASDGHDESSWGLNRRVELVYVGQ